MALVQRTEIAAAQEWAVTIGGVCAEGVLGRLRTVVVAAGDASPTQPDLADVVGGQSISGFRSTMTMSVLGPAIPQLTRQTERDPDAGLSEPRSRSAASASMVTRAVAWGVPAAKRVTSAIP